MVAQNGHVLAVDVVNLHVFLSESVLVEFAVFFRFFGYGVQTRIKQFAISAEVREKFRGIGAVVLRFH